MDILTELKKQAEQVEVLELRSEKTTVEFEANQLKYCTGAETQGTAVRVIRNGRLGFSASTDGESLEKLSANALESAAYGDKVEFSFPAHRGTRIVETFDPTIRNQAGLDVGYQTSPLSIGMDINRVEGDDVLIVYDMFGATLWDEHYLEFAHQLVDKLKKATTIVSMKPGKMPVLFSPTGVLALLLPLSEALNGKEVYKGTSPLKGKVGEVLFDKKIGLMDDGTIDGKFASAAYDDEGIPHRCNELIEAGVLKGFIYDLKTAAQAGVESTGNGSRGLFTPPQASFTNLTFQPGETPVEDMLAGIDEGMLVEDLLSLGQGNIISGAFSNPLALAFKIEKGEITGRVKNLSIAGNVHELLMDVSAVSQEARWVYGTMKTPYILLPEMNVAGKE